MDKIVDMVRSMAMSAMIEDDSFEISAKNVQMNFTKKVGSKMDTFIQVGYGSFSLPSFCEMVAHSANCDSMQFVVQVS